MDTYIASIRSNSIYATLILAVTYREGKLDERNSQDLILVDLHVCLLACTLIVQNREGQTHRYSL